MTDRELMQMALDTLKGLFGVPKQLTRDGAGGVAVWNLGGADAQRKAIEALRARFARPEQCQLCIGCGTGENP